MLFSFLKLKELANMPSSTTIEDVNNAINSIGYEVEEFNKFADVEGIKFGKVLETSKNPNADKLTVCRIEFDDQERIIQTAATNVVVGDVVIAFVPGSRSGEMTFAAKELKGVMSEGMLSSPSEFGLSADLFRKEHIEGIAKYNYITDLSIDPIKHLGLDDFIIDIKILSNRADANAYYSMALELAAYFGTKVNLPKRKISTFKSSIKHEKGVEKSLSFMEAKKDFSISMQDQFFLAKSGIKSVNDVADLSNLILIMTGQPTHAYDKTSVGTSFKAEYKSGKVNIFGNKEVILEENLVITSDNEIVSVAGVIGIEEKATSNATKDFILEFGRFNIKDVRKSAKTVKLNTMASNQSSKEFTEGVTKLALDYASELLNNFSDVVSEPELRRKFAPWNVREISMLAGMDVQKDARYEKTLSALEIIGYRFMTDKVEVPSHINGIDEQQDMNEEFFRYYGFDNLKPQAPKLTPSHIQTIVSLNKQVAAQGYNESVAYTLISAERNIFNPFGFAKTVKLETFVSKEREVIRDSMLASMLEIVEYNQKRKMEAISIFDIGMINDGIKVLALASTVKSFAQMLSDIKNVINLPFEVVRFEAKEVHKGTSAKLMLNGEMIGWIGKSHPSLTEVDMMFAEIKISSTNKKIIFSPYSQEQLKQRDITLPLNAKYDVKPIIDKFRELPEVYSVEVIDTFAKEGKNNTTFRIIGTDKTISTFDEKYN